MDMSRVFTAPLKLRHDIDNVFPSVNYLNAVRLVDQTRQSRVYESCNLFFPVAFSTSLHKIRQISFLLTETVQIGNPWRQIEAFLQQEVGAMMTCLPEVRDVLDLEAAQVEAHLFVVEEEEAVGCSLIAPNPAETESNRSSTRSLDLMSRRAGRCQPISSALILLKLTLSIGMV